MKQRITVEQIRELTPEQGEKLREWWKPKDGDWFYGSYGDRDGDGEWILSPYEVDSGVYGASLHDDYATPDDGALPLLTIGQMIELLCDNDINIDDFRLSYIGTACDWVVCQTNQYGRFFPNKNYTADELCDSLWQAIKEAL